METTSKVALNQKFNFNLTIEVEGHSISLFTTITFRLKNATMGIRVS